MNIVKFCTNEHIRFDLTPYNNSFTREFINYSVRVRKLINMVFSNKINYIGRECAACNLIFF